MRRGQRRNSSSAERNGTHMLLKAGEGKQRSERARSSRPTPDDFHFAIVYLSVSRIYASKQGLGFTEIRDRLRHQCFVFGILVVKYVVYGVTLRDGISVL